MLSPLITTRIVSPVSSRSVSAAQLLCYALPGFALAMPTIPAYVFLPALYGASIGLKATGLALLASRGLDVLIDPAVGAWSDRSRSRWGRRKPWIVAGVLIGGWALIRLFQPPPAVDAAYLLLWSMLLYLGWTLVQVPYTAWAAEMSGDYHERSRIAAAREGMMLVGIVAAGTVPVLAARLGYDERTGLAAIAWMAAGLGVPFFGLLLWRVSDPLPTTAVEPHAAGAKNVFQAFRALGQNRPFLRLVAAWFVNGLANGIPAALFLLYLEHGLGADAVTRGALTLGYFVAAVAAIPGWLALSRRVGKHRAWCSAMMLTCAAFVWVPFLSRGDVGVFAVICFVTGLGLGADVALPPALQADLVDYDTWRQGRPRAGLFFALWSMSTKLALALAVGIAFPVLAAFGFHPEGANDARALTALAVIYAGLPVVLKAVAIAVVWDFPITLRRQRAIRKRLDRAMFALPV